MITGYGPVRSRLRGIVTAQRARRFHENEWGERHYRAWMQPRAGVEDAIVQILDGLAEYADAHAQRCESPIGDDGVLGDYWLATLAAFLKLRDGEMGPRFDMGALGEMARGMANAAGFSLDEIEKAGF